MHDHPQPPPAVTRAAIARTEKLLRLKPGDPELTQYLAELRANYTEHKLADYITKVVGAAPPLTAEQRDRLAALLSDQQRLPEAS
jgi:hypothetical protein